MNRAGDTTVESVTLGPHVDMFDHKCAYEPCGKFGHNILNCRKLAADKERQSNKRKETGHQPTGS